MRETESTFAFDFELEAFEKAGVAPEKARRIGGFVSTADLDKQGERVLQEGLDFSPFLQDGWFNDNHSKATADIVGFPETAKLIRKGERLPSGSHADKTGWFVEGYLLQGHPPSDKIWELASALQKTPRRLGFSVEGRVTQRMSKAGEPIVARAVVKNVAITNCFPGDVRVSGAAEKIMRRFYSGPMIEIVLSTGEKLTGTPNHPVFTQRGWVALRDLDERHDRVGRLARDLVDPAGLRVAHDVQNVPSALEEVFDLARLVGSAFGVGTVGEGQLHGDAEIGSDVDIVVPHGELRSALDAAFTEKFGEDALPASDKEAAFHARPCLRLQLTPAGFAIAPSAVRGLGALSALGGGGEGIAPQHLFVPVACDTFTPGDEPNGSTRDSVFGRDGGRALSSAVGFSNLTSKRTFDFSGHVFNLDTVHGWYEANGIVAHNCPVNNKTALEVLAKSLAAADMSKALEAGAPAGPANDPGAVPAGVPLTGAAAGRVLMPESITGYQPGKRKKRKKLAKSEALDIIRRRYPGITNHTAERIYRFVAQQAA